MKETVTFTHHEAKPEYKWEIVIPEGPTILLPQANIAAAMDLLHVGAGSAAHNEIEALPNGGSRSVDAELGTATLKELTRLGVKTV